MPLLLTGCLGTQHLEGNQKRLIQQSIKAPKEIDEEALREMYAQRPNRRFLGLPIYHLVAIYYWGERNYNKEKYVRKKERFERKFDAKIAAAKSTRKKNNLSFKKQKKVARMESFIANGNQRMQWGEKVAVFDSGLVEITVNRFKNYLASEGYYDNRVTTTTTNIGKFITLTYRVDVSNPYTIDSIFYRIGDSAVYKLVKANEASSFIKVNQRLRSDDFDNEAERIDLLLKDNGYYDFSRQYISFPTDTSLLGDRRVTIMVQILDPARRENHKQFTIDSVRFLTDAGVLRPGRTRQKRVYRDIQYSYYDNYYSLKILSQRVFLHSESLYNRTKTFETQKQLANLDAFKFVNVVYDTSGGKFIANIFTSPVDRYEWSNEAGVNVTQGFPGPFYNLNFKKRNIFRGLENFELNARAGIEGVASATVSENIYKSIEAGANASLIFPQFIWPLREARQVRLAKYNPKTRLSLGYTYTDRPEYTRAATTLSSTYAWQNQRTTEYTLSLANVSLINSNIKSAEFQEALDNLLILGNYNLVNSFRASFVSSMIFGITWNHNYGSIDKNSVFIRGQFETGGTSLNFIDPKIITDQGLQYFKYLRVGVDFRRNRILNSFASLAYRVNTGMTYDYSGNNTLPYEKFYFAGGSRSVRAWSPRRLGVGSQPRELAADKDKADDGQFSYQFEKPGEILLEGSVELRSKLVGFIDGALFIDAGNVWSFRQYARDTTEAYTGNSQFRAKSFLKELGIGTGFGLRFDFTFLILCFDVGIKVYDPARLPGDRFVLDRTRFFKPYATQNAQGEWGNFKEPVVYNVGIGYPF
ncbi:MAG TPA: BamA/TamA family outer membrane protein [Chryseosolibacter sp.]